jgi:protein-S-isoprenylcysteine O-methyltransferase Ste14
MENQRMIPEVVTAVLLIIPIFTMIAPSVVYWSEFRKEKKKGRQGRQADYNKFFFYLLVAGYFAMWAAWAGSIVFLFLNKYHSIFGPMTFSSAYGTAIRMIGLFIFYVGAFIYNLTIRAAGKYLRPAPSGTLENHRLVQKGPFALIRHPLYVSYILVLSGLSLVLAIYWLLVPASFMIIGIYPTAKAEEKVLIEQFGDEYVKYKKCVGMFFPKCESRSPGSCPGEREHPSTNRTNCS